jgi:hypothetical protein
MKKVILLLLFFESFSSFFSNKRYSFKKCISAGFLYSLPLFPAALYYLEKKYANGFCLKYKKKPQYRNYSSFSSILGSIQYSSIFGFIPRPEEYEKNALMKVRNIGNCFYRSGKKNNYDKDFTQSVVSNYIEEKNENERNAVDMAIAKLQLFLQKNSKKISDITQIPADSENPYCTITLTAQNCDLIKSDQKITVELDMGDYKDYGKFRCNKASQVLGTKIKEIDSFQFIDARLFDKKISYGKVFEFIEYLFPKDKNEKTEGALVLYRFLRDTTLFLKKIDNDMILHFFDSFEKEGDAISYREEFKKHFVADLMYGIFPDTCNGLFCKIIVNKEILAGLKNNKKCNSGCHCSLFKASDNSENIDYETFGPLTLLEGIYFTLIDKKNSYEDLLKKDSQKKKEISERLLVVNELITFFDQ